MGRLLANLQRTKLNLLDTILYWVGFPKDKTSGHIKMTEGKVQFISSSPVLKDRAGSIEDNSVLSFLKPEQLRYTMHQPKTSPQIRTVNRPLIFAGNH